MIKTLLLLIVGLCLGLFLSAWTAQEVTARFQAQCGGWQMVDVRLYSAECVADGSAPVDCVDRARREFCK
jgi:hypothetical protein